MNEFVLGSKFQKTQDLIGSFLKVVKPLFKESLLSPDTLISSAILLVE